ncbi:hypothetical protein [Jiangella muralis]|uniref:hypothetical protein n=1 Tax=Jiangella muralis TaxID=702383 RepID=UPI0012FBA1F7|nr:hypothetical protein [Jiangella muralis]
MITSSKRSAVAAAVILSAASLAGCGGGDDAASGAATPTPAWESTPGEGPTNADAPDETPAAEDPQAAPDEPVQDGGEEPGGQPADGGDAAGAPADGGTSSDGGQQPDPGGGDDGEGDAPPPVAQPIDACTLGADAIATLIGAAPTPEDMSDPAEFGPSCGWIGAGGELVVSVSTFDDWVSADGALGSAENVDGLGAEAWASLSAPSNLQVAWRRDDVSVSVSASLASGGAELVDVARAIDAALLAAGY